METMHKITVDKNGQLVSQTVTAIEADGKTIINLHSETYNLMLSRPGNGKRVNEMVAVPPCGYEVKVERDRTQTNSPLPIRAFKIRSYGLSNPIPEPQPGVVYIVSQETMSHLIATGDNRPDIWSPYSVQEFQVDKRSIRCATAMGQ